LATIALAIRTALFAWEWAALRSGRGNAASPLHWRAQIAFALLQRVLVGQATLFVASNAFLILAIFNNMNQGPLWAALAFLSTVTSQILDRYSFFAASAPPRMPGAVA
jgi:hypothetical protein